MNKTRIFTYSYIDYKVNIQCTLKTIGKKVMRKKNGKTITMNKRLLQ